MRKKDRLHRRAVRTKDQHHWKALKRQRNSVSNLIKVSHNSYLNDVIGDSLTENPKKFFSYVKHSRSENLGIPPLKTEQGVFVTDKDKAETLNSSFFLFSRMNNYLYLKFLYLLTLRLLTYIHHPKELLNNYPSSTLTRHAVLTNCLHMYWKRYLNLLLDGLLLFFSHHSISTRFLQIGPRPLSLLFIRKTINLFPQITDQSL